MSFGKLAVIIPVYNVEKYLEKCKHSLLNQSYQNINIIFVDDGSTDNSGTIIDSYEKQFNNVTVIHKKNGGVSSARNFGLNNIADDVEYVSFLDADDMIEPMMFEMMIDSIKKQGADICICRTKFVDEDGKELRRTSKFPNKYIDSLSQYRFSKEYTHYQIWGCVYKKIILEDIRFDETLKVGEDILFLLQAIEKSSRVAFNNDVFYHYLSTRLDSTMNKLTYDDILAEERAIQKIVTISKKYPFFNKSVEIWRATHAYANLVYCSENNIYDYHFQLEMQRRLRKNYLHCIRVLKIRKLRTLVIFTVMVITPKLYKILHNRDYKKR